MKYYLICILGILNITNAYASNEKIDLLSVQHQWAITNYQSSGDNQVTEFNNLILLTDNLIEKYPDNANFLIWNGIVKSSFAGAKGGLSALSLVKAARKSLDAALTIDPNALQGSAYTSLGTLYHKVPGWPLGFGDEDKAEDFLKKAIEINPSGLDSNYFYAEFMYDNKEYSNAQKHLQLALLAAPRPDRPLADKARREEIQVLLAKVNKFLE